LGLRAGLTEKNRYNNVGGVPRDPKSNCVEKTKEKGKTANDLKKRKRQM